MRVRGLHRLAWEWCRITAKANKQRFADEIAAGSPAYRERLKPSGVSGLDVISFCGATDFPEQVLSMLTYLAQVGSPLRWTVYGDGTLGPDHEGILKRMPFPVTVAGWDCKLAALGGAANSGLLAYAKAHALGKKYFAISQHVSDQIVLYADSDLLFYPLARRLIAEAATAEHWFLPDIPDAAALDQGLPDTLVVVPNQVNSGLMMVRPGFNWTAGNDYIASKAGHWGYFTEQTAVHISMLANGARPFDSARFIVSDRDQFAWRPGFPVAEMAARHYVRLVRHLIWRPGWKWHFLAGN